MIEGITYKKRTLKTPFAIYEIYYNGKFLDYVWQPLKWDGPKKEKFLVPNKRDEIDEIERDYPESGGAHDGWDWFSTLDAATNHVWTRIFIKNL